MSTCPVSLSMPGSPLASFTPKCPLVAVFLKSLIPLFSKSQLFFASATSHHGLHFGEPTIICDPDSYRHCMALFTYCIKVSTQSGHWPPSGAGSWPHILPSRDILLVGIALWPFPSHLFANITAIMERESHAHSPYKRCIESPELGPMHGIPP